MSTESAETVRASTVFTTALSDSDSSLAVTHTFGQGLVELGLAHFKLLSDCKMSLQHCLHLRKIQSHVPVCKKILPSAHCLFYWQLAK